MSEAILIGAGFYGCLVTTDYIRRIVNYAKNGKNPYYHNWSRFLPCPFDIIHDDIRCRQKLHTLEKKARGALENLETLDIKMTQDLRLDKLFENGTLHERLEDLEKK